MENNPVPQTLMESIRQFSDADACLNFMIELRWPNGVTCPRCQAIDPHFISTRKMWRCNGCKKQFSVKVGTIFEDSPLPLDKWLAAVWLITNAKNGISSYEIHRALGITQKSAWFVLHRVRFAMTSGSFEKMKGTVESDETYIGGKARNMHEGKRKAKGRGAVGKSIVQGLLERHATPSRVKAKVVPNARKGTVQAEIRENVARGSEVFTDSLASYEGLDPDYVHEAINHAEKYIEGKVHTNGLENFWSLLKRMIRGTYVSIAPFHLQAYLDEEAFRFNERLRNDGGRFLHVLAGIVGRRLTWKRLTGKLDEAGPGVGESVPVQ
jgi:transposase-like protein